MILKKGNTKFTTTDPVQIAAFKNSGYTEVKPRGTNAAPKQDAPMPETEENLPETEDTGDAT